MATKIDLVIIDPQLDFCAPPDPARPEYSGSLYVQGADKDMERLAVMIGRLATKIDDLHITLDSHQELHVAHPIMWRDERGQMPNVFTILQWDAPTNSIIGLEFNSGQAKYLPNGHTYRGTRLSLHKRQVAYVQALAKNGRYPLCIWPPHCRISSWGQGMFPPLFEAVSDWCKGQMGTVDFVTKGSNILTEHYSAIVADVPDPEDSTTQMNTHFLDTVDQADLVLLAGEAYSHCLANTGRDACNYFKDDSFVKKLVLLEDCTSSVSGFEYMAEEFKRDLTKRGMQVAKSTDYLV